MEETNDTHSSLDRRIAGRLKQLRIEAGWSLDELAARSGVSRATLSRLEHAEVSPTAAILGKLCTAHGMTMSRLIRLAEDSAVPLVPHAAQPVWTDRETGFVRRSVSPPASSLSGEVIECRLPADADIAYQAPPRSGLEHHLVMVEGTLTLTVDGASHRLSAGDCLRYQLSGASRFQAGPGAGARYFIFIV